MEPEGAADKAATSPMWRACRCATCLSQLLCLLPCSCLGSVGTWGARGAGVTRGTCGLEMSPGGPANPTHTHACARTHKHRCAHTGELAGRLLLTAQAQELLGVTPRLPRQTSFPCLRPSRGHSRDVVCACREAWHSQNTVARRGFSPRHPPPLKRARQSYPL